jgi:arginyl-tRNA synthetase
MPQDCMRAFDREILSFLAAQGIDATIVRLDTPADRQFGERATNVAFLLKKERNQAPRQIAQDIAQGFDPDTYRLIQAVEPAGPGFINFRLNYESFTPLVIGEVRASGQEYGGGVIAEAEQVVVEHTSVNPNKEWHIGHVRNAVLGDVVNRALRRAGHSVAVQNYIDDTGLQAAEAVLGLRDFPEPRRAGEKYDHWLGRMYVKIAGEIASEPELRKRLVELDAEVQAGSSETPDVEAERASISARLDNLTHLKQRILGVMHELEAGQYHDVIVGLLDAQLQTAYRLGIYYDLLNWESHLVQSHVFEEAIERVKQSPQVFQATEGRYAGALIIVTDDSSPEEGEPKAEVLIRSNGIPTYVGKDIAYHMWKFGLLPERIKYVEFHDQPNGNMLWSTSVEGESRSSENPDRVINVIAVNQTLPQQAVNQALRVAGFEEAADELFHLAYGLVSTREGKISGRKGTSVSADAVIDEAVRVAHERVKEKRSADLTDEEMREISEAVGVGAVRYFMVQYNPLRDIVFDVSDVVSYDGNTGLYVQYALVRMAAILRRASSDHGVEDDEIDAADMKLLQHEQEKRLIFQLAQYPDTVATVTRTLAVNLIAEYAYDLATTFSQFYRDCGVLNAEPGLRAARLLLVRTVQSVLSNACELLGVPVIERL